MHQPWASSFNWADSKILNLSVLAIIAFCSYNFFERTFLKFKKKFTVVPTSVTIKDIEG